jgi:hypothetical protein
VDVLAVLIDLEQFYYIGMIEFPQDFKFTLQDLLVTLYRSLANALYSIFL